MPVNKTLVASAAAILLAGIVTTVALKPKPTHECFDEKGNTTGPVVMPPIPLPNPKRITCKALK